jgi:carbon monoxide dehydrogenase subunit G
MTTVTVSSRIDAPTGVVFEQFTDLEHATAHVSGIKRIEVLTQGVFQLGTRWRETREVLGRTDSAEMEVTSFERNKTYTITHHKAGVRVDTVFSFEPTDDGTKVSIEFELDTGAFPPGLLTPFSWAIAGKVRDVLGTDLADLKKSIEK